MKSHTKPALRAMPAAQVQISLPVQGVLRDMHHAFLALIDIRDATNILGMDGEGVIAPSGVLNAGITPALYTPVLAQQDAPRVHT